MRIFSTFSGIGGFEIGIQNAIKSNRKAQQADASARHGTNDTSDPLQEWGQSATCIGYSEIDKYAIKVYERNFTKHVCDRAEQTEQRARTAAGRSSLYSESRGIGNEESNCNCERPKNYGDITKIRAEELPDFDCLVGGFPCQAFSIAGKRKGFEDTRGTLFFDLARILRAKQPRLFVFENVKGLLSHDGGRTFKTIIQTINELGYDCQWQVLNSKNFGVPQNRERVYIVGHLRGTPRPEVFPITGTYGEATESQRGNKIAIPVLTPDRIVKRQNGRRFKTDGEPAFTVNTQDRHGVVVQVTEATIGQAINLSVPNSKTRRGRVSDIAPTLDTGMQLHTLTEDIRIRRLTPIECERLQGFPDNWTSQGTDGAISDTQRYKMCGNAVTTNVVQAVFERIFESTTGVNQ